MDADYSDGEKPRGGSADERGFVAADEYCWPVILATSITITIVSGSGSVVTITRVASHRLT
ncbi:PDZ_3 domain-containing protein [Psidium guajava]|nr:PDZ_3 domain-containing protein [Psidium guajava]